MADGLTGLSDNPEIAGRTLSVLTAIHGTQAVISKLNSMTFLYDPSWAGDSENITYPFCVFHVVSAKEIQESAVSTKRIILYDGSSKNPQQNNYFKNSMVDVIADNVVTRPKTYELQVYIPFSFLAKSLSDSTRVVEAINFFVSLYGEDMNPAAKGILEGNLQILKNSGRLVEGLERVITGFNANRLFGKAEITDTNKDSLFAMMENRSLLKLKTWDSWDYKNVVITNIAIDKDGKMDDYYTGTIKLQELPVLNLTNNINKDLSYNKGGRRWSLDAKKGFDRVIGALSGGGVGSLS